MINELRVNTGDYSHGWQLFCSDCSSISLGGGVGPCHSQGRVTRELFTRRMGFILGSVFNKVSLFNLHIITK